MKTFVESIVVAFSMYSKIPMPQVEWNDKNMRFSFVVFPLVGAVIAAVLYVLNMVFHHFAFSPIFFAGAAVFTSVFLTGGIHLDGYGDTTDALNSHKEREEKLRILKDPHVGSFAVIYTVAVLLLQFGSWVQIYVYPQLMFFIFLSFILSRSLAGLAIVSFPCARNTGLASIFSGYASKKAVRVILMLYVALCTVAMLYVHVLTGGIIFAIVILSFTWFYSMVKKQFGGITGDLAGFYIVICETAVLLTAAVTGGINQ